MAETPDITANFTLGELFDAGLDRILDAIRVERVLDDVRNEIIDARRKHGKQADLPFGTGPDGTILGDLSDWKGILNVDVADVAKARTDRAADLNTVGGRTVTWEMILTEEFFEAMAEDDPALLRAELKQVAAMAISWMTIIDEQAR